MKSIVLVGAGQLGSRHLQALAKLETPHLMYVVDPSEGSLEVAKERYEEVDSSITHQVHYVTAISDIECSEVDYCIIATTANYRLAVIEELVNNICIAHLIFEKVLFQSLAEYEKAQAIIDAKGIKAWVNCPFRLYPFYQEIKAKYLQHDQPIHYDYKGGEWVGLACNSIHYIDHVNFYCDSMPAKITANNLELTQGKRQGFIEFTGQLFITFADGSELRLESVKASDEASLITISQEDLSIAIEELTGKYTVSRANETLEEGAFDVVYQSNLTHLVIQEIEKTGQSGLSDYTLSKDLHLPYVRYLLSQYNELGENDSQLLPIT